MIKVIKEGTDKFNAISVRYSNRYDDISDVELQVSGIGKDIVANGDRALFRYTKKWDNLDLEKEGIKVTRELVESLKEAAKRIEKYQSLRLPKSWYFEEEGGVIGERILPLESVGVYVPGGKASYPSTVLMNVVPALVAGVKNIVMVTPFPNGEYDPAVIVAADMLGVKDIFKIGGAQAVYALAYGTESVPKVDKIVGPGNIYVATAKKQVFGRVDIDMIAGPSEILIVATKGNPEWIASDILSQAEHDEKAYAVCLTDNEQLANDIVKYVKELTENHPRKDIIEKSLSDNGAVIVFNDRKKMYEFANDFASEHLELNVDDVDDALSTIKNAGAVFIGDYSAEPVGDYMAGPDHTLPTGGTARFFSPLGVEDFLKRSSIIKVNGDWIDRYGKKIITLAEKEGLFAHAKTIELRIKK